MDLREAIETVRKSVTGCTLVMFLATPPAVGGDTSPAKTGVAIPSVEELAMPNGGLQNVVLYLSSGLTAATANSVPTEEPIFDQKGCLFRPHVLAVDVNQKFKITSSDQTMHNVHPSPAPGSGNAGWNKSLPPGAPSIQTSWKAEEIAIPVKCNIHPWMRGWLVVVKGPYAVSDENGNFKIKNVPAGAYTLTAWQEEYGTRTAKVIVVGGQAAKVDFTFDAK